MNKKICQICGESIRKKDCMTGVIHAQWKDIKILAYPRYKEKPIYLCRNCVCGIIKCENGFSLKLDRNKR